MLIEHNPAESFKAKVVDALEVVLKPKLAEQGLSVFKNHRYLTIMNLLMNSKEGLTAQEAAFSNGNTIAHNIVMKVGERMLDNKFHPQNGQPRQFVAERETDFDKVGLAGTKRDRSMLKKNYNFDIAVADLRTKKITAIIEVEQSKKNDLEVSSRLRDKLIDCIENIDGLEHAYVVKVIGETNPIFHFFELVKSNGLYLGDNTHDDGFSSITVREICGVNVTEIEKQVREEIAIRLI